MNVSEGNSTTKNIKNMVYCNHPTNKLSDNELNLIESRMYPGKYSQSGFLKDNEKLKDVIKKDEEYLKSVNITFEQIADRLRAIELKYERISNLINIEDNDIRNKYSTKENRSYGKYYKYDEKSYCETYMLEDGKLQIEVIIWLGGQECPFQNHDIDDRHYLYGTCSFNVKVLSDNNESKNNSFCFNSLLIHLIKDHYFFEGDVFHRIDPQQIIQLLDIKPNVDYSPDRIFKTQQLWKPIYNSISCFPIWDCKNKDLDFDDDIVHTEYDTSSRRARSSGTNKETYIAALRKYSYDHEIIEIKNIDGEITHYINAFLFSDPNMLNLMQRGKKFKHIYLNELKNAYLSNLTYQECREIVYKEMNRINEKINNETSNELNKLEIYSHEKIMQLIKKDEEIKLMFQKKSYFSENIDHDNNTNLELSTLIENDKNMYVYFFKEDTDKAINFYGDYTLPYINIFGISINGQYDGWFDQEILYKYNHKYLDP
jgi:hypothetical protein